MKSLNMRSYECVVAKNKAEAAEMVLSFIPEDSLVSWGGTSSMNEAGVIERVKRGPYRVIDRGSDLKSEEALQKMREALLCDCFLMSANALSEDGVIVNIDGRGNRIAALSYGPKLVIMLVGVNKIVKNEEAAVLRAKTVAAPINAQRYPDLDLPCVKTGECFDCKKSATICNHILITRGCRPAGRIKIVLCEESLGY